MEQKRARIIAEIDTMEQAGRVEETVRTGYVQVIIESILQWTGVEEDLADSYEKLAAKLPTAEERDEANRLARESRKNVALLSAELKKFESLDEDRGRRIEAVKKLAASS